MTGERVLVTGATGFIGGAVARDLVLHGYRVRALRRPSSDPSALLDVEKDLEWATGDVTDRASLVRAMAGMDHVVHAAGFYPVTGLDIGAAMRRGVTEMRTVVSAVREARVKRFVYTSTLTTIGRSPDPKRIADERDRYVPGSIRSAYAESKWAMELEALASVARGVDCVVVNPTIVLGPGDVKPTSGRIVTLVGNGMLPFYIQAKLNAVDVRDVATGHRLALERGGTGERYILGGENLWTSDLMRTIAREAGSQPPMAEAPYGVVRAFSLASEVAAFAGARAAERLGAAAPAIARALKRPPLLPLEALDVLKNAHPLDCSKAREELGVTSRPLVDTIRDALAYFRGRGLVGSSM